MTFRISQQPVGKMERAFVGGGTAVRVGKKVALHYVKRPFLASETRRRDEERMIEEGARTLFAGLSLLKGTALKMAQLLSLEMDLLPEAACRELAKACHQVPPINRALVRKVFQNGLGRPPEEVFAYFDSKSFAAASLGQVHGARDAANSALAVKVQYPGIAATIKSDVDLLRRLLWPVINKDQLLPALSELSDRLHEEVNYCREAENISFFAERLKVEGVRIPSVRKEMSAATVLTTALMPGTPLNQWLLIRPHREAVDHVARKLQEIFIRGLYELQVIHADPNPGNFIIADDLTIGLVDFGCVKRLSPDFVEHYRRISAAAYHRDDAAHFEAMKAFGMIPENLDRAIIDKLYDVSTVISRLFGRLCEEKYFDFKANPDFIRQGKAALAQFHHLRRHLQIHPDLIFLDRTRYGLLRLYEQMGARVCFRNSYEYEW